MKPVPQRVADFLPEGEDADGFLKTPQGDVERMGLFGFEKEAVQADLQEFQFFQERADLRLVGLAPLDHQLMTEMPGMTPEGRGAEAMSGGQSAEGHASDEGAVDVRAGGVMTDGTASRLMSRAEMFRHRFYSSRSMVSHRRDACAT
jgi:hypothetical protein